MGGKSNISNKNTKFSSIDDFLKRIKINEGDELKDLVERKQDAIDYVKGLSKDDKMVIKNICTIWNEIEFGTYCFSTKMEIIPRNIITKERDDDKTYSKTSTYNKVVTILYALIKHLVEEKDSKIVGDAGDVQELLEIINEYEKFKTKLGKNLCLLLIENGLKNDEYISVKNCIDALVNPEKNFENAFIQTLKSHSNPLTSGATNSLEIAFLEIGSYLIKHVDIMQKIYKTPSQKDFMAYILRPSTRSDYFFEDLINYKEPQFEIDINNSIVRFTAEIKRVFAAEGTNYTSALFKSDKNKEKTNQANLIIEKLETFLQSQNKSDNTDNINILASKNNQPKIAQEFLENKDEDKNENNIEAITSEMGSFKIK